MEVFKRRVHEQEQDTEGRQYSFPMAVSMLLYASFTSFRGLAQAVGNANGSTLRGQLAQRPCSKSGLFDLDLAKCRHWTNLMENLGRCGKNLTSFRTSF